MNKHKEDKHKKINNLSDTYSEKLGLFRRYLPKILFNMDTILGKFLSLLGLNVGVSANAVKYVSNYNRLDNERFDNRVNIIKGRKLENTFESLNTIEFVEDNSIWSELKEIIIPRIIPPDIFHLDMQDGYSESESGLKITLTDKVNNIENSANNFGQTGIGYNLVSDVRTAPDIIKDSDNKLFVSGIDINATNNPNYSGVAPVNFPIQIPRVFVSSVVVRKLCSNSELAVSGNQMGVWSAGVGTNNNFLPPPYTNNFMALMDLEGGVIQGDAPTNATHQWLYYAESKTGFPDVATDEIFPIDEKIVITVIRSENTIRLFNNKTEIGVGQDINNAPWEIGENLFLFWSKPIPFPSETYFVSSPSPYGIYDLRFTNLESFNSEDEIMFNIENLMSEYNIT